jgi:hypothetical protein
MKIFKYLLIIGIIILGVFGFDFVLNYFNTNYISLICMFLSYLFLVFLILKISIDLILKKIENKENDNIKLDNQNENNVNTLTKTLKNITKFFILTLVSIFFIIVGGLGANNIYSQMIYLGPGNFLPYIISGYVIYCLIKLIIKLPKRITHSTLLSIYLLFIIISIFIFYKNTQKIILIEKNRINHEAYKNVY